jgi:hypothetical protein
MSPPNALKCGQQEQQESDPELWGLNCRHVNSRTNLRIAVPAPLRFPFPLGFPDAAALHHGIGICTRLFKVAAVCSPLAHLR